MLQPFLVMKPSKPTSSECEHSSHFTQRKIRNPTAELSWRSVRFLPQREDGELMLHTRLYTNSCLLSSHCACCVLNKTALTHHQIQIFYITFLIADLHHFSLLLFADSSHLNYEMKTFLSQHAGHLHHTVKASKEVLRWVSRVIKNFTFLEAFQRYFSFCASKRVKANLKKGMNFHPIALAWFLT